MRVTPPRRPSPLARALVGAALVAAAGAAARREARAQQPDRAPAQPAGSAPQQPPAPPAGAEQPKAPPAEAQPPKAPPAEGQARPASEPAEAPSKGDESSPARGPSGMSQGATVPVVGVEADEPKAKAEQRRDEMKPQHSAAGLRLSMTRVRGADRDDTGFGLTLAGHGESYFTAQGATGRATHAFAIGGGSVGFEGAFEVSAALGARAPIGDHHGPFARVGVAGSLWGNSLLYSSMFELPQVQAGYQLLDGTTVVELGARAGAVLAGRYNPGDDASRKLGSAFEYGAYGAVHVDALHLHGSFMRVDARRSGTGRPVDIARGALCAWAGGIALCADGSYLRGDVEIGAAASRRAESLYGGVLVGWVVRE